MAVYEHTYQAYAGPLTPTWSRFLVIPRYAYHDVFRSKLFTGLFAVCFVPPLIFAILIYLHHNTTALAIFQVQVADLIQIDGGFFRVLMMIQQALGFLLTVIVAPALISRDVTNNALPLYLCRPLTRAEYVLGKMSVVMILLSLITWVPGLLLFLFQTSLAGLGWARANLYVAAAIFVGSWAHILMLALFSQALSAWIKWRLAASGALFALYVAPTPVAFAINGTFHTNVGGLIHPSILLQAVTDSLFRYPIGDSMPEEWMALSPSAAWLALAAFAAVCLLLLALKVRAYEVVKG
jgi:ABC-2 type transport system permease protein